MKQAVPWWFFFPDVTFHYLMWLLRIAAVPWGWCDFSRLMWLKYGTCIQSKNLFICQSVDQPTNKSTSYCTTSGTFFSSEFSIPSGSQPFLQGLHRLWRAYLASPAAGESADGRRECPVLARGAAGAAAHPPGPVGWPSKCPSHLTIPDVGWDVTWDGMCPGMGWCGWIGIDVIWCHDAAGFRLDNRQHMA